MSVPAACLGFLKGGTIFLHNRVAAPTELRCRRGNTRLVGADISAHVVVRTSKRTQSSANFIYDMSPTLGPLPAQRAASELVS